jgi:predicted Fe-Mo cluster-binding NifX family protein
MKPFDLKVLEEKLKAKGLPAAESLAEKAAEAVFEWSKESVAAHENALVKALAAPAIAALEEVVKEAINKIDGDPA